MKKKKKIYEAPTVTKVKLNPSQAVLSVCSTTASPGTQSTGGGSFCRANMCLKKGPSGDSMGQS